MALFQFAELLIMVGTVLVVALIVLAAGTRVGTGQAPGDITWRGKEVTLRIPIATTVTLSIALTIVAVLLARLFATGIR